MDDIYVTAAVSPWLRRQWSFIFAQICFYTIVNFFLFSLFRLFLLIYELKFFMFYASHFDLSAFLWVSLKEKKVAHLLIKTISWFSSVWCIRVPFFHRNNLFLSNLSNMKFALCSPIHPNLTNWKYWYYLREIHILCYFGVSTFVINLLVLLQDISFMTSMPNVNLTNFLWIRILLWKHSVPRHLNLILLNVGP